MSDGIERRLDGLAMGPRLSADSGVLRRLREDVRVNMGRSSLGRGVLGFFYSPGLLCVVLHRLSAWAYRKGPIGKLVGIIVWRCNVWATGAYIHPNAEVGTGLRLPHPVGVVVGNGVVVGAKVTIYQNVTLGTAHQDNFETYPRIGHGTTIYAGAVVVGGVRIGTQAVIGANAVVLRDVPDGATAVGVPARVR